MPRLSLLFLKMRVRVEFSGDSPDQVIIGVQGGGDGERHGGELEVHVSACARRARTATVLSTRPMPISRTAVTQENVVTPAFAAGLM